MKILADIKRLLLDTNAFLYFINNDSALSKTAKNLLESEVDLVISTASLWEIAIKFSIGKLVLPDAFGKFIPDANSSERHRNFARNFAVSRKSFDLAVSSQRPV